MVNASAQPSVSIAIIKAFYKSQLNYLQNKYLLDFQLDSYYKIDLLVSPCINSNNEMMVGCYVSGTQEKNLTELNANNYYIEKAGPDLHIGWAINNTLLHCANEFQHQTWCGSFLEIHRPLNATILSQKRITKYSSQNYSFDYLSTKNICAGKYEVWFVFRTSIGYVLQFVKPFFIQSPSCNCQHL